MHLQNTGLGGGGGAAFTAIEITLKMGSLKNQDFLYPENNFDLSQTLITFLLRSSPHKHFKRIIPYFWSYCEHSQTRHMVGQTDKHTQKDKVPGRGNNSA